MGIKNYRNAREICPRDPLCQSYLQHGYRKGTPDSPEPGVPFDVI